MGDFEATKALDIFLCLEPIWLCLNLTLMSLSQVGEGPCDERQINLIKDNDNKKPEEWVK